MIERLRRATEAMQRVGVDALLLAPGADLFYLTGFEHGHAAERLLALVLRRDGSARWISPAMNVPQVEERALPGQSVQGWTDSEGYLPALREAMADAQTIAFDDEARAAFLLDLIGVARGARVMRAGEVLRGLRLRKDADELAALRRAARQVDETIPQAIALCQAGRTEEQIDRELRAALLRRDSASAVAFTIIAGGPNSALPHHETGRRTLRAGDAVILDFGTRQAVQIPGKGGPDMSRLYGYLSDITLTCGVGEPADPEMREVYRVVWEAQQAAIRAVRPGATCEQIDRAARSVIEAAGYGPNFLHRTGHGLGLQGHEPPFLKAGNSEVLEEGMVFSIEPGIYLPGRFGVRLEIIVGVTSDGVTPINAPSVSELPVAHHQGDDASS